MQSRFLAPSFKNSRSRFDSPFEDDCSNLDFKKRREWKRQKLRGDQRSSSTIAPLNQVLSSVAGATFGRSRQRTYIDKGARIFKPGDRHKSLSVRPSVSAIRQSNTGWFNELANQRNCFSARLSDAHTYAGPRSPPRTCTRASACVGGRKWYEHHARACENPLAARAERRRNVAVRDSSARDEDDETSSNDRALARGMICIAK